MGGKSDWYRRTTWTPKDAAEFERRLSRARTQRSQYLRIQSLTLAEQGDPKLADVAIELARRSLAEDPDSVFTAELHLTIAQAYATKGDMASAVKAYREAMQAEKKKGQIRCMAYLQFAWFAATRELTELYEEALDALNAMQPEDLVFPITQYMYFGTLAIICDHWGDSKYARRMARNAMNAAKQQVGPFPCHRTVGLVEGIDPRVRQKIEALAS